MAGGLGRPTPAAQILTALKRELIYFHVAVDLPLLLPQLAALEQPVGRKRAAAPDAATKLTQLQSLRLAADELLAAGAASQVC